MRRTLAFLFGLVCYVVFLATFLYAIGFLSGTWVPKSIDSGRVEGLVPALAVDTLLLTLFAVQHSGMARRGFKRWWGPIVPAAVERSAYVLLSSLVLALTFWQWRPLPRSVWQVDDPVGAAVLWGLFALGWGTVLLGTFMISHAHLFGLAQVWARLRDAPQPLPEFQTRWLYRYVRHPLMLGFLVAFWSTPRMSAGHLLFAAGASGYILLATLRFEERDLEESLGEPYRRYRRLVPAFVPRLGRSVPAARGDRSRAIARGDAAAD
jgi:protein-S-isoprenylcysteine O-methyltransferase Ste14